MSLAALLEQQRTNRFALYDPMRGMDPFHRSRSQRRFVRAPNQIGKTIASAWETWAHALGQHPHRTVPGPGSVGWFLMRDLDGLYATWSEKMHEVAPMWALAPDCGYVRGRGFMFRSRRMIVLSNGSIIEPKSGTQAPDALESGTVDWLGIDEPPKPGHFDAALQRVAVRQAPVWMTFTPVNAELSWLRLRVEGNPAEDIPPREDWETFRPTLTVEDCTTVSGRVIRSAESIAKQIASMSPWTEAQRRSGEWEGQTEGRRFVDFREDHVLDDAGILRSYDRIRVGIDHGEGPGKQVVHVVGVVDGGPYVVLAEWTSTGTATPAEVASALAGLLHDLGFSPHHVERVFGDINSAGLVGGGRRYNDFLEEALARVYGSRTSPIRIETPKKNPGSVEAGEAAMSFAMREGRWLVHRSCRSHLKSMRNYRGPKDPDLKDAVDAARYAVHDLLLAPRATHRPAIRTR